MNGTKIRIKKNNARSKRPVGRKVGVHATEGKLPPKALNLNF